MGDENIRAGRDAILVDGRSLRRAHARHVGQVLDRYRQARQHAALAHRPGHQAPRLFARPVEAERRERIDHAVHGGNARFQRFDAIQRRNRPRSQAFHDLRCGHADEIGHAEFLVAAPD